MITMLRAGMRVRLPSGNVIVLLSRGGKAWTCEYVPGAARRGEIELSAGYLRKFGEALQSTKIKMPTCL